ncbi:competence protein ComA [Glaesserella parasuis]|uniref:competence protein ComA n=1 Tax=Glaesserella parasuis TaxID=738 RepID=UPI00136558D3|nr:competence protein ComA [Glaesserella parasuis]MDG6358907.1 competence protein ComA [Glaesserella parasuis]MDG6452752.1 competence protein ComA [Glaesserella parasuis]MDO9923300.1 competence protein ComA [Glaesserella parasuis]MDP0052945.1 competence protein ComA [Glaesserella parasuis]MDP0267357.1 competence protein ComA [Glaesserella parasuis]
MGKFFQFRTTPQLKPIQVGFFWQENTACIVYFEQEQPHTFYFSSKVEADSFLQQFPFNYQLIQGISHQHIWRKTLILPELHSHLKQAEQIIRVLKQSLPLALSEVNIDYHITPLAESHLCQLNLYALRKSNSFDPTAILDCELYCLLRAVGFLTKMTETQIMEHSFHVQDKFIHFQNQQLIVEKQNNSTKPIIEVDSLPQAQHFPHFYPYLIALGASLWNGKASI